MVRRPAAPSGPAKPPRVPSRALCLGLLLLCALLPDLLHLLFPGLRLTGYGVFLTADLGPLKEDYGNIFLPKLHFQQAALRAGELLLWNPFQYAGTAHWPLPNTATAYVPLALALLLRGALGGLNLAVLMHALWGAFGVLVLVERTSRSRTAGLAAGVFFLYARLTLHLAYLLPWELMAIAWLPWTLYFVVRASTEERWAWNAVLAGACYAGVTWAGGYIVLLRGLLVVSVVLFAAALRPPARRGVVRAVLVLAVLSASFLALSAGRLLPTWQWIPLTNRAAGLEAEVAMYLTFHLWEVFDWIRQEGWIVVGLALLALYRGLRGRSVWGAAFGAALLFVVVLSMGLGFEWMRDNLPGFNLLRGPRRIWVLTAVLLPVLAGLGFKEVVDVARREGRARPAYALLFLALLTADKSVNSRFVMPRIASLSERIEKNALHQDLARRAASEPRFRVHDYADTGPALKCTADVVRAFLELESLDSMLGNIAILEYDRTFLMRSTAAPARMWGMLGCRYVTSGVLLDEPGLELLARFEEDPGELHPETDGPFLYRNELSLPRAALAAHAVLLIDAEWAHWQTLCVTACWDPATTVAVLATSEDLAAEPPDFLERFAAVLFYGEGERALAPALRARLVRSGTPHFEILRTKAASATDWIAAQTAGARAPLEPLADPPREWNRARVALPGGADRRWLVLAETYSIYPGWTARIDGRPARIYRANCAGTALALPPGAREVELEYRPPGFRVGMAVSLAAVAALGLGAVLRARRGIWPR